MYGLALNITVYFPAETVASDMIASGHIGSLGLSSLDLEITLADFLF